MNKILERIMRYSIHVIIAITIFDFGYLLYIIIKHWKEIHL